MLKKITAMVPILLGTVAMGLSQETKIYTHDQKEYQDALALYHNEQYQAAQSIFSKVKDNTKDLETKANSAYYEANAAVRLNQLGADRLMEDFVEKPNVYSRNSYMNKPFFLGQTRNSGVLPGVLLLQHL